MDNRKVGKRDRMRLRFHHLRIVNIPHFLSSVGLLVLFPGFLLYHLGLAAGVSSPVFGGLFGVMSAALLLAFVSIGVILLSFKQRHITNMYIVAVIGFLLFVIIWTTVYFFLDGDKAYIERAAVQSYQTIVLWTALFFCGMFMPEDSRVLKRMFLIFIFMVFGFLLIYVLATGNTFFYAKLFFDTGDNVATYQGFARSLMVTSFLSLPLFIRKHTLIVSFSIMVLFSLFVLGARSDFIGFIFGISLILFAVGVKDARFLAIVIIGIIILAITFFLLYNYNAGNRIMNLLNLESDRSWSLRQDVTDRALVQIYGSPIIGNFGTHVSNEGNTGGYAHNVISSYVNYGLIGFIWYLMLLIVPVIGSLRRVMFRLGKLEEWSIVLGLAASSLLLVLAAKSVFWPVPALVWGLYARVKSK